MGEIEDRLSNYAFMLGASIWECRDGEFPENVNIVMQGLIDGIKKAQEEEEIPWVR